MSLGKMLLLWSYMLATALLILLDISCTEKIAGSEVTNEDAVCLVGKVLNQKGDGIPNIIASIYKIKLADTTDISGNYSLKLSRREISDLQLNLDTLDDSVKIISSGSVASSIKITKWIDTMPSTYLIQRNIYGKLESKDTVFKRIEAVIAILDTINTVKEEFTKELWFNKGTRGFSGFCYFPKTNGQNYSIYIKIFNKDSIYTGKSQTIYFNELAGDIEIPLFSAFFNSSLQIIAGNDTSLSINDTLQLSASVNGDVLSKIINWEWNLNGKGFVTTTNQDTTIVLPNSPTDNQYIVKATDSIGNVALDTIVVHCIQDTPILYFLIPQIPLNTNVAIKATASDLGKITKWEWNIDGINYNQLDSNHVSYVTFESPSVFQDIICRLKVTDDDGNTKYDSSIIHIGDWIKDDKISPISTIVYYNNKFYTVFQSYGSNYDNQIGLKTYNGVSWENVGKQYMYKSSLGTVENLDCKISNTGAIYSVYTLNDSLHVLKYIQDSLTNIGTFPFDHSYEFDIRSCITQDGTLYVSKIRDSIKISIILYRYKNGIWTTVVPINDVDGHIRTFSMETINNDIYLGGNVLSKNVLYKYDGNNIVSIMVDQQQILENFVFKSYNNDLYICGNYNGSAGSPSYFLKKYTNSVWQNIDPEIKIDGDVVNLSFFQNELFLGIVKNTSYGMHSGLYTSYLYKYSANSIVQVGEPIMINGVLIFLKSIFNDGNYIYALLNDGDVYKLQ